MVNVVFSGNTCSTARSQDMDSGFWKLGSRPRLEIVPGAGVLPPRFTGVIAAPVTWLIGAGPGGVKYGMPPCGEIAGYAPGCCNARFGWPAEAVMVEYVEFGSVPTFTLNCCWYTPFSRRIV